MLQLYKSLVQPELEYCIQAWRPYLCKDIEFLEKAQRRAVGYYDIMFSDKSVKSVGYYERLRMLGLTALETRRLQGDIIEVFKIFKGLFEDVSYNTYFTLSQSGLNRHSYKLYKPNFRLDIRKFLFFWFV